MMRFLLWPGLSVHRKVAVGSAQARGTSDRSAVSPVLGRKAGRGQERRGGKEISRFVISLTAKGAGICEVITWDLQRHVSAALVGGVSLVLTP